MATNGAICSYSEIIDLSTKTKTSTCLGFRVPQGIGPIKMMSGFWSQFRYVKYLGQRTIVQAIAQLPVDPLKVGEGTAEIDQISPKTLANPIMFKGCHGESLNDVLNNIYRDNGLDSTNGVVRYDVADPIEGDFDFYYSLLSDNKFKKYPTQRSFILPRMYPMINKLSAIHPILPSQNESGLAVHNSGNFTDPRVIEGDNVLSDVNFEGSNPSSGSATITEETLGQSHNHGIPVSGLNDRLHKEFTDFEAIAGSGVVTPNGYVADIFNTEDVDTVTNAMLTSGVQKLGWLPTTVFDTRGDSSIITYRNAIKFPNIMMGIMILPPTYQDSFKLYFRLYIKHYFAFKGFTSALAFNLPNPKGESRHDYTDWLPSVESNNADIQLINAGVK